MTTASQASWSPAPARPLWARPPGVLVLVLVAMSSVLLMSPGSLLCLPGPLQHLPKAIEVYKGKVIKGQRIDILVEEEVIVEIKSLTKLPDVSTAQILSYLKATGLKRGLLINFGAKMLREGVKRISL